jgi:hypothetical protein
MSINKTKIAIVIITIVGVIIFWKRKAILEKIKALKKTQPKDNIVAPSPKPGVTYYECSTFPLRKGCKGKLVMGMQVALNKYHNQSLKLDGYFGPQTELALEQAGFGKTLEREEVKTLINKV